MRKKGQKTQKRASYNKFLDELEELPAATAIEKDIENGESTHPKDEAERDGRTSRPKHSLLGVHLQHMHLTNRVER